MAINLKKFKTKSFASYAIIVIHQGLPHTTHWFQQFNIATIIVILESLKARKMITNSTFIFKLNNEIEDSFLLSHINI